MADNYLQKINEATQKAVAVLEQIREDEGLSKYARKVYNKAGFKASSTKIEDMLEEAYDIACGEQEIEDKNGNIIKVKKAETDDRLKAIKLVAEMVGGGLNEKQTNIQNNISGNFFLDMLSNKK